MNYNKHYERLCKRAKERTLNSYKELHHIIPRCLGGTDNTENIVALTPEEHYVAHQLLVKMHPNHGGLIWEALQMTGHLNGKRNNNKIYGWLRRRFQKLAKDRKGKKNGSYGKRWYYNPETLENVKCLPEEAPKGFIKGRKLKPNKKCPHCGKETTSINSKYCERHKRFKDKEKAIDRFEKFLNSDVKSIRQFAKVIGVSQPALTRSWKIHIPNYKKVKQINGKEFNKKLF